MSSIVRLPDDLKNKIAAGEVVERPASVVKELVENALDAGAKRIQIEIASGGLGLIRVTDDGCGMDEADASMALDRHATSKVREFSDLLRLHTFGFRGEALPSVASVSNFTLRSRQRSSGEGVEVTVVGSADKVVSQCGMAAGTIVEVRDLFFNVPARRKFLKSVATESAAISAILDGLALSSPEVSIVLSRDGRVARQWLRAKNREERVLQSRADERLEAIRGERGPLAVEAFLGPPETARAGAAGLLLLVNGRVVRDRAISRTVAHAYGSVIDAGRFPSGVVYLDIDPSRVDVNVHPQKAEVRFSDSRAVTDAVYRIVSDGLASAFGIVSTPGPSHWQSAAAFRVQSFGSGMHHQAPVLSDGPDPWGLSVPEPGEPKSFDNQIALDLHASAVSGDHSLQDDPTGTRKVSFGALHFLTQVRQTFLVCEHADGLVIIDQHAAAERVAFSRLRRQFQARAVASQQLLVPATLRIDDTQEALIEQSHELILQAGLDVRIVGPSMASVFAVPNVVSRCAPEQLARDFLDEIAKAGGRSFSDAVDLALATMACHASLRAGESVSPEQAASLLAALDDVDFAGHCPHGRPLVMQIRFDELERQVGRR